MPQQGKATGLMRPTTQAKRTSSALEAIRTSLTPKAPQTLEQQLDALSEAELGQLQSTARLVQMSANFGLTLNDQTESYAALVQSMYPAMPAHRKALLIELLNNVAPLPEARVKPSPTSNASRFDALAYYDDVLKELQPLSGTSVAASSAPSITDTLQQGDDFLARLTQSESSGNSKAEITIGDGRRFVGSLQFGEARLQDYQAATGKQFTQDEFQADEALQDEVALWHFKDIDKSIEALGDAAKGYDRDGLRSVAHLGGKGGMKRFVQSSGEYNPSDELGTSLSDYYTKFSTRGGDT